MEHRIHFTRREQSGTLQSHLLVPVSINGHSALPFAIEPSRSRTLVSARTVETLGLVAEDSSPTVTISDKLAYRLLRVDSLGTGSALVKDFEVVVWGQPVIAQEILENMKEDALYPLGNHPNSAIEAVIECRGILGADFLRRFKVQLDFGSDNLILEA